MINVQAREIQRELEVINPDYKRILVKEEMLHLTLGTCTIDTEDDFSMFMYEKRDVVHKQALL